MLNNGDLGSEDQPFLRRRGLEILWGGFQHDVEVDPDPVAMDQDEQILPVAMDQDEPEWVDPPVGEGVATPPGDPVGQGMAPLPAFPGGANLQTFFTTGPNGGAPIPHIVDVNALNMLGITFAQMIQHVFGDQMQVVEVPGVDGVD